MPEALTTSIDPPPHPSMDFASLRDEGIRLLQELAGDVWTDHNSHDPGITILEALCYAITDLAYRTDFPIEDLLVSTLDSDRGAAKPFYTAEEILPSHAQTALDYRKVLIDHPNIRDAWVEPHEIVSVYDLRLMPVVATDDILNKGQSLVIVALVNIDLHIRIFDSNGKQVVDKSEDTLVSGKTLTALKRRLDPFPDESSLTEEDRQEIIGNATSIAGHTPLDGLYRVFIEFEDDQLNGDVQFLNHRVLAKGIGEMVIRGEAPPFDDPDDPFIILNDRDLEIRFPQWHEVKDQPWVQRIAEFNETLSVSSIEVLKVLQPDPNFERFEATIQVKLGGEILIDSLLLGVRITSDIENLRDDLLNAVRDRLAQPDVAPLVLDFVQRVRKADRTLRDVKQKLHQHRNLCEDFFSIDGLTREELGLQADIIISADANVNDVLALLYRRVDDFLSPRPRFHSLDQILAEGTAVDQIYDGPLSDRGILKSEEMVATTHAEDENNDGRRIYESDLVALLMKVPGVKAVEIHRFNRHFQSTIQPSDDDEFVEFSPPDRSRPRLSRLPNRTKLRFSRESKDFRIGIFPQDPSELDRIQPLRLLAAALVHRLAVPQGSPRDIQHYDSIQHEFPSVYGLAINEQNAVDSELAIKRHQLKAYLLIFEQFLANYLAQLSHTGSLLAVHSSRDRTLYTQLPVDIPGFVSLLNVDQQQYEKELATSFAATDENRETRLLDHLLARFGEPGAKLDRLFGESGNSPLSNEVKRSYLEDFPRLSRDRGTAFDLFGEPPLDFSRNVSGLEQKIETFIEARQDFAIVHPDNGGFRFRVQLPKKTDEPDRQTLLTSVDTFGTRYAARQALRETLRRGRVRGNYLKTDKDGRFFFTLTDRSEATAAESASQSPPRLARSPSAFLTIEEAETALTATIEFLNQRYFETKFYLVEHLLLMRPDDVADPNLLGALPVDDPFSFQFSLVMPNFGEVFGHERNQQAIATLVDEEVPAHLVRNFYGLEQESANGLTITMAAFEEGYRGWLQVVQNPLATNDELVKARAPLLDFLRILRLQDLVA